MGEANNLIISSCLLPPWKFWPQLGCKYASFSFLVDVHYMHKMKIFQGGRKKKLIVDLPIG